MPKKGLYNLPAIYLISSPTALPLIFAILANHALASRPLHLLLLKHCFPNHLHGLLLSFWFLIKGHFIKLHFSDQCLSPLDVLYLYIFICLLLDVVYKLIRGGILFDLFAAVSLAVKKASDTKCAVNIC